LISDTVQLEQRRTREISSLIDFHRSDPVMSSCILWRNIIIVCVLQLSVCVLL